MKKLLALFLFVPLSLLAPVPGPLDTAFWGEDGGMASSMASFDWSSLLAHWKFDEATGTSPRLDSVSTNHVFEQTGVDVSSTGGKIGDALLFGDGEYLSRTNRALFVNDQSFSINFWFSSVDSSVTNVLLQIWSETDADKSWKIFLSADGEPSFATWDGSTLRTALAETDLRDGVWHMITCVANDTDTTIKVYVDNGLGGNVSGLTEIQEPAADTPFVVGNNIAGTGGSMDFKLDSLSYFKGRALNDSDIMLLYNNGAGLDYQAYDFVETWDPTTAPGADKTWTAGGAGGTINTNYTTSPAPLAGTESCFMNGDALGLSYFYSSITARDSNWVTARFLLPSGGNYGNNTRLTLSRVGVADDLKIEIRPGTTGTQFYWAGIHGSSTVVSNAIPTFSLINRTNIIWIEWRKGSGANGIINFWFTDTGSTTRPASPEFTTSSGNGTNQPTSITLQFSGNDQMISDSIKISPTPIGNNP